MIGTYVQIFVFFFGSLSLFIMYIYRQRPLKKLTQRSSKELVAHFFYPFFRWRDDRPLDNRSQRQYAPETICPETLCPCDIMPRVTLCSETICPSDIMPRWTTCPSGHYGPVDNMARWTIWPGGHYAQETLCPG